MSPQNRDNLSFYLDIAFQTSSGDRHLYTCPILVGSALDHRSLPPEFDSRRGHIWFHLWFRLITFRDCSAHLAYLVHKSGRKTSIIINHPIPHWSGFVKHLSPVDYQIRNTSNIAFKHFFVDEIFYGSRHLWNSSYWRCRCDVIEALSSSGPFVTDVFT